MTVGHRTYYSINGGTLKITFTVPLINISMNFLYFSEEVNELERLREARLEAMFPDEVDTPRDTQARVRFQKYRGLKSFRTTVWDPKENLPYDYGRIFQFENFLRTKKRILSEAVSGAEVGWYVKIYVKGVGAHLKPQIEG